MYDLRNSKERKFKLQSINKPLWENWRMVRELVLVEVDISGLPSERNLANSMTEKIFNTWFFPLQRKS